MLGDVVRAALGMQHRIAARIDRLHHVGHGRQRLVLDLDESDRVLGDVAAVGDHQHHRLADMAHFAERDAALLDRRIGKARQRPGFLRRLLAGDHCGHAGQRQRRALVDRLDAGVRMRAAQHRRVRHVRQRDVVDEAAAADQEARILLAQHARADDIEPLVRPLLLAAGGRRKDFAGFRHQRTAFSPRINSTARSTETDDVLVSGKPFSSQTSKPPKGQRNKWPVHMHLTNHYEVNSSRSAFAFFRSRVSKPSVNHSYTGANSSRASTLLPWSRLSRARLMARAKLP